jgi:hypothetical protein
MAKDRVTSDVFFTLSAHTKTLEEFRQMTVGIIPFDDHQRLFDILEEAEPIYDELIWDPYYAVASRRLKELKEYADKARLGEKLVPVANFLNSSWSPDIPVIVSFAIVPGEMIKLVPPPIGNVIRAGLLTESDDYWWYAGIIAHEFSHRAFAEQPLNKHQQIDQWFTESKSPHRGMVNLMFNEVLGGAIGHKVHEDLSGESHEFTYARSVIRDFDEAIYPLVSSYLDEDTSIDRAFVNESVAIYEKTFPNALYEYRNLFQAYYLLTDAEGAELRNLDQVIAKNIVGPMMYEVVSGFDNGNVEAMIAYDFTKVILVTKDNARTLEYLKGKISALNGFKDLDAESDFVLGFHDAERNPYVIVNVHSVDAFEEVAKKLKAAEVIDPEKPLVRIEL